MSQEPLWLLSFHAPGHRGRATHFGSMQLEPLCLLLADVSVEPAQTAPGQLRFRQFDVRPQRSLTRRLARSAGLLVLA
jgi:hypothetical protein